MHTLRFACCNMAICDLPDMYALNPWACSPQALDIHIRQIPHGHVTTITYIPLKPYFKGFYYGISKVHHGV